MTWAQRADAGVQYRYRNLREMSGAGQDHSLRGRPGGDPANSRTPAQHRIYRFTIPATAPTGATAAQFVQASVTTTKKEVNCKSARDWWSAGTRSGSGRGGIAGGAMVTSSTRSG